MQRQRSTPFFSLSLSRCVSLCIITVGLSGVCRFDYPPWTWCSDHTHQVRIYDALCTPAQAFYRWAQRCKLRQMFKRGEAQATREDGELPQISILFNSWQGREHNRSHYLILLNLDVAELNQVYPSLLLIFLVSLLLGFRCLIT